MRFLFKILNNIERYILLIAFPLMLMLVFSATFSRYLKIGSFVIAEEASRSLMIWLAFAGISLVFKNNSHLGLSFLTNRLQGKTKSLFFLLQSFFIITFGLLVAYFSYRVIRTQIRFTQVSPSMGMPIWWVYSAILFGSIMIIIRVFQNTFNRKQR